MDTRTSYKDAFMSSLRSLRDDGTCDVTMKLRNSHTIDCHRLVLMAASPFFKTMFRSGLRESTQREVDFDFPSSEIAVVIIDYFYSGEIDINSNNVQDLIAVSEYLCLDDLKKHLCAFMTTKVDSTNCMEFYRFSRKFNLGKLVTLCLEYILSHFDEAVTPPKRFDELSEEELIEVVSDDRLTSKNEDIVYHSIVHWVNADLNTRKEVFPRLASLIRFPFCSAECLSSMTREALMINPTCMEFLHEDFDERVEPDWTNMDGRKGLYLCVG
ncbi:hypothetical protein CAPTEDRAFT_215644 [Capitella teleta]|uniref:BTB domain-containing protein n=1 Tax=Capitella teleta TaxID=283909 RepID=R7V328_CAPTE|nr:hypothetical protein CAPTEDRAFT_215644 [Capitella teleta]|eukprot:ELU10190.1 hypothetical protein CAPTEDRAFT_215644 [Capitella teleta]